MIDEMICNGKRFRRIEYTDIVEIFEAMVKGHDQSCPLVYVFLPNLVSDVATEPMHELRGITAKKGYTYVRVQPSMQEYVSGEFFYGEDPDYVRGYVQIGKIEHFQLTLKLQKVYGADGPKVFIRIPLPGKNFGMKEVKQSVMREGIWSVRVVNDSQPYEVTDTNLYYEAIK